MMKKTTQPTENLQEQGRTPKGRFAKGFAQNPTGRKAGSRNKATEAALALMEGQLGKITQTLINAALGGDLAAIRLVLERLVPPCKEKALPQIHLPTVTDAQSLPKLTAAVLDAVSRGDLTPGEANALASLVGSHGKAIELAELEDRLPAARNERAWGVVFLNQKRSFQTMTDAAACSLQAVDTYLVDIARMLVLAADGDPKTVGALLEGEGHE